MGGAKSRIKEVPRKLGSKWFALPGTFARIQREYQKRKYRKTGKGLERYDLDEAQDKGDIIVTGMTEDYW